MSELYPEYKDKLIWPAVPGIILILATAFVGFFGNANIIIATCRTKALHTNCCILIATTAFFDIIHQLAHIIFALRFFAINYFMELDSCFYMQIAFVFAMNFGSFAYLSVGLDRLCCVIFPSRYYNQLNRVYRIPYLVVMLLLPTVYSSTLLFLAHDAIGPAKDEMVVCFITDVFYGHMQRTWNSVQWITFAVTVVSYCLLWLMIRIKNATYARKLTKTVTYIMGTLVFGWFITTFVGMAASQAHATPYTMFLIHTDFGWPANLGIAANYFIYYSTNTEYRRAFSDQLAMLFLWRVDRKKRNVTDIHVISDLRRKSSRQTG
ncbi:unnamed protein product [Bursaphelenchus xylophilus]|uniref:(pine wood nematode) hypothetical protein n=1 Tax=Bursaphelenchus xylophilus TaxID=6326 RepID=A0A1I7RXV8_BURXY|nr:unnamed protein product [Bursaphelenchus xylophilus]CAG9125199.1 unnamed protein product [Bursaphelenchus xylophilus]